MKNQLFAGLSALMITGALVPFADVVRAGDDMIASPAATEIVSLSKAAQPQAADKAVTRSGSFVTVDQSHPTTGTARIVEDNGQRYIEFDGAFDTARGPAVQVVLYNRDNAPVNLAEGDYAYVGDLQSFSGAQRYAIPADIDLDIYESVVIWCEQFNVTFGYADI
ncbi:MAG: DM13 domain-containing protein [Cyanobacteria bacterium J06632_22]